MINAVLGTKKNQTQKFLEDGTRIPVTEVEISGNWVTQIKTPEKHGYFSVQLGMGRIKKPTKAQLGHTKKGANLDFAPNFLKEIRVADDKDLPEIGKALKMEEIFELGDIIDVLGRSKGKGFAGGVKRHHFKGGPRTHGQSDRERAPGSIGQTTTPGRVYKNKRMAGKMGFENVTVRNLQIVDILPTSLLIKGLVPGPLGSKLIIEKKKKAKKFTPLVKIEIKEEKIEEQQSVKVAEKIEEKTEEVKQEAK